MCNAITKCRKCSKKGTTLVELVVAMTLTLLFAVVCVALINPIERTYQATEKIAHAQLLADTVIDSIRKECDDVQYDDPNAVWIAAGDFNDDPDDGVLFASNTDLKSDSGFVLVVKKNNNYCEAIYSCFPISDANIQSVKDNPVQGNVAAHAATSISGSENMERGIVHFGYYQAKYSKDGMYPLFAYDYTNPITASTYEGFTVSLTFQRIGRRQLGGEQYPAYVECTVNVLENDSIIYSRTAAICFSANGSAQGNGSNSSIIHGSGKRDIRVTVNWDDDHNSGNTRPTSGVKYLLCDGDDVVLGTYELKDYVSDQKVFIFADVDISNGVKVVQQPNPVNANYKSAYYGTTNDGFYFSNEIEESTPKVRLLSGIDFRNTIGQDVTNIIFCANTTANLALVEGVTPIRVSIDRENNPTDDYLLYIVNKDGKKYAYILSTDGTFVANENCESMFNDCRLVEAISGLDGLDTRYTTNMNKMFRNIGAEQDNLLTIDIRNFSFESCTDINKMFCTEKTPSKKGQIETIIFPEGEIDMSNVEKIDAVFSGCTKLKNLWNFNNINFESLDYTLNDGGTVSNSFYNCSSLTTVDFSNWNCPNLENINGIFNGLSKVTELDISGLNVPKCNSASVKGVLSGLNSIQILKLNRWGISGVDNLDNLFKGKTNLHEIYLNDCVTDNLISADSMFSGCSNLTTLEMRGFVKADCTDIGSMFYNCKNLNTLTGLTSWDTSGVTDMAKMFYYCHTNTTDGFELDLRGFEFGNVIYMNEMFNGSGVSVISFPGEAERLEFTNVESIEKMFLTCKGLTRVEGFNVSFPKVEDASSMFGGCSKLESADYDMHFAIVENINNMFSNCTSLSSVDLTMDFPQVTSAAGLFTGCTGLTTATLDINFPNVSSVDGLFQGCTNLTTVDLTIDADSATSAKYMFSGCTSLTSIAFDADIPNVTDISYMFSNCSSLKIADIDLKFANVTTADNLFNNCKNLETVKADFILPQVSSISNMFTNCAKLSTIDSNMTFGKVENINNLFKGCTSLSTVNLSLSVPEATTANYLFSGCTNLKSISFDADFPNVTDISYMFNACTNLSTVNVDLDYPSVKNAIYLFAGCKSLKTIPNTLNLPNATDINYMFKDCISLEKVERDLNFPNAKNALGLFQGCTGLKEVKSKMTLPNIESLYYTFYKCTSLESVDLSYSSFDYVDSLNNMFEGCSSLKKVTMEHVNLMSVTRYNNVFKDCNNLEIIDMSYINLSHASKDNLGFVKVSKLKELYLDHAILTGVTSLNQWIKDKSSLEIVDFSGADLSGCTSFEMMFFNCQNLKEVYFSYDDKDYDFTLSACTTTKQMFKQCYRLETVKMNKFITPNNTNCSSMFESCYSVTNIQMYGWDTSKVTDMSSMFYKCCFYNGANNIGPTTMTTIDISSFDFTSVTNMYQMFMCDNSVDGSGNSNGNKDCLMKVIFPNGIDVDSEGNILGAPNASKLVNLSRLFRFRRNLQAVENLGYLTTSTDNLNTVQSMFSTCESITTIDIRGLNISKLTGGTVDYMFDKCTNLVTIIVDSTIESYLSTSCNGSNMFRDCTSIVGGNGTTFLGTNKKYAKVDGGSSNPGYFTAA